MNNFRTMIRLAVLALLCFCSIEKAFSSSLPADITMNKDAGRGNELFVAVRLKNGEPLPFIVDTGASSTVFDKSLEPQLGKCLGAGIISMFGVKHDINKYSSPILYLGKTPLVMTGPYISTFDLKPTSTNTARSVMGILGMNVLSHYCIQLDFSANKIRFLDDEHADKSKWGKAFPLINAGDGCFFIMDNLSGARGPGSLIDTGCADDGWLVPALFKQWTNQAPFMTNGAVYPYYGVLDGEVYPEIYLQSLNANLPFNGDIHLTLNGIGIQFLSRNLVTLDFPRKTMYLKRTSIGFLVDKDMRAASRVEAQSAFKFLVYLKKKGRLPGFVKGDDLSEEDLRYQFRYPDIITFDNVIRGWDLSLYHYELLRISKGGPWKLIKAWRTDQTGRTIEEYPVP